MLNALSGHQVLVLRLTTSTQCFCVLGVIKAFSESAQIQHRGYCNDFLFTSSTFHKFRQVRLLGIFPGHRNVRLGVVCYKIVTVGQCIRTINFFTIFFKLQKLCPLRYPQNVFLPINSSTVNAVHAWQRLQI